MGLFDDIQSLFGKKDKPTTPDQPEGVVAPSLGLPPKKILIVEDEKLLANALESKFKHENFIVYKAENGQIGLDMAIANKPDIILLDLMMPVMDGKTMLHKLREMQDFKFLPVVVLTNAGEVDNMRETKTFDNASAFLIKSNVNPDDIVQVVHDSL
ncbi:MAG TPA: response regulator [Candidatus Saccharimonadales bacterium]|nr:response regulator [Candidatus Saccharimonadales bacterium]